MSKEIEAPVVYRFVAPDGRSYVGSVRYGKSRAGALARGNTRICIALKDYPAATWRYEVLESFAPGCGELELRSAEQWHTDRLRTLMPEHGFNMFPAVAENSEQRAQYKRARAEAAKWLNEVSEKFWSRFSAEQRAEMQAQFRAPPRHQKSAKQRGPEITKTAAPRATVLEIPFANPATRKALGTAPSQRTGHG
jgi:hypothetical protein